jgi:hypothetical protein
MSDGAIQTGPRGGRFKVSASGNKRYGVDRKAAAAPRVRAKSAKPASSPKGWQDAAARGRGQRMSGQVASKAAQAMFPQKKARASGMETWANARKQASTSFSDGVGKAGEAAGEVVGTARKAAREGLGKAGTQAADVVNTARKATRSGLGEAGRKAGEVVGTARKAFGSGVGEAGYKLGKMVGAVKRLAKNPMDAIKSWVRGRKMSPDAMGAMETVVRGHLGLMPPSKRGKFDSPDQAVEKNVANTGSKAVEVADQVTKGRSEVDDRKQAAKDTLAKLDRRAAGRASAEARKSKGDFPKGVKDKAAGRTRHPKGSRQDVEGFRKASGKRGLPKKVVDAIAKGQPVRHKGKVYDTPTMKERRKAGKASGGDKPVKPPKGKEWMATATEMTPAQHRWALAEAAKAAGKKAGKRARAA